MTRKHFKAIAQALNDIKPNTKRTLSINWAVTCGALADVCASQNPRFNRSTFIDACENGL